MSWPRSVALLAVVLAAGCTAPPPTPTEPALDSARPVVSSAPSDDAVASDDPVPSDAAAPSVTAAPSQPATPPSNPPDDARLDSTGWTTYVSEQHGFGIGHPPDWSVVQAVRSWAIEVDAGNWESPAYDVFLSADRNFWVVAWTAPYAGGESLAGVHRWVDDYCRRPALPCDGDPGSRVPLCNGRGFCHPGLLLPDKFPQAIFTGGAHGQRMTVVASGRPPAWPAPGYGNARQVFEAILSTMDVCLPGEQDARGCDSDTPLAGAATGDPLIIERR
ncbi:hypothetical protein [Agrococcus jenensis]|uniref:Uncharacterized protein n=1 Tax=Agrococcus jenensis TaxID=46353 RepID=A0A3N2AQ09_9MICO|nr:hypothetical protein [Agrococcus jenensis]ROR64792.1 hypothetical protein EDD26_0141 [Agrococcus jenensis]